MMQTALENFPSQFHFQPVIENKSRLKKYKQVIVLGMGGSHLAADLVQLFDPSVPLRIHSDYGLPAMDKKTLKESLILASSYSGNTEEVIDGLEIALKQKLNIAVLAVGGKLIDMAKKQKLPYVQMPNTGIQPRSALGLSLIGMLSLLGQKNLLKQCREVANMNAKKIQKSGEAFAKTLLDQIPVVYSSKSNMALAYNWKIKLNETGKIPAFYNIIPELNHNEMTGFDIKDSIKHLGEKFHFIFLQDSEDHLKNQKRMKVTSTLYKKRGLHVTTLALKGKTRFEKIFSSLLLADWTAVALANHYGLESEQVPMVEEFKKLVSRQ